MATRKSAPRPSAIVRAEHDGAPVHLTKTEQRLFDAAVRLGEDLADEVESKVAAYGRWLLAEVFANDASSALDDKTKNTVWTELVRRAGGPTLRVGKRTLYVALRLAAYDHRITDQTWRELDAGRKERLLPLHDERRLREAAQHVTKFKLTQVKTEAYVNSLLAESGKSRDVRLTGPVLMGRMKKLHETLGATATMRKVRVLGAKLTPIERTALILEIEKVRDVLTAMAREVRRR